jgi:hypothetical protein
MILNALKKRLFRIDRKSPGRWIHELPAVVLGLRTQSSRNTGASPYFMVYGAEAVLPADIAFRSPRVENFDEDRSNEARVLQLNSSDEERLDSCARTVKYLAVLCKYYNKNIKERFFVVGDLVLKWKTSQEGMHKLSSPWEGPFEVVELTRPTSYWLAHLDGTAVPNSWHIDKLRRFYP